MKVWFSLTRVLTILTLSFVNPSLAASSIAMGSSSTTNLAFHYANIHGVAKKVIPKHYLKLIKVSDYLKGNVEEIPEIKQEAGETDIQEILKNMGESKSKKSKRKNKKKVRKRTFIDDDLSEEFGIFEKNDLMEDILHNLSSNRRKSRVSKRKNKNKSNISISDIKKEIEDVKPNISSISLRSRTRRQRAVLDLKTILCDDNDDKQIMKEIENLENEENSPDEGKVKKESLDSETSPASSPTRDSENNTNTNRDVDKSNLDKLKLLQLVRELQSSSSKAGNSDE